MCIIKQQIQKSNYDSSIKINIGQNVNFTGLQQGIDTFTGVASAEAINPVTDLETFRFNLSNSPVALNFYFYSASTGTYQNSFLPAGYTPTELSNNDTVMLNSFFIANFYDTFNSQTQIKYFTGYLTYVDNAPTSTLPNYIINPIGTGKQFYYWYIPNNYIETHTGSTATGYTIFTFYNAKLGGMQIFFNQKNSGLTTNEKMYFKTVIDFTNKTFHFSNLSPLKAYELPSSSAYSQRYNNTVESMENIQEQYPTGTTFNYRTGRYGSI